eukprot:tig00020510_g9891.t1
MAELETLRAQAAAGEAGSVQVPLVDRLLRKAEATLREEEGPSGARRRRGMHGDPRFRIGDVVRLLPPLVASSYPSDPPSAGVLGAVVGWDAPGIVPPRYKLIHETPDGTGDEMFGAAVPPPAALPFLPPPTLKAAGEGELRPAAGPVPPDRCGVLGRHFIRWDTAKGRYEPTPDLAAAYPDD